MAIEIKHLTKEDLSKFTSLINLFNMVFEEESKIGSEANSLKLLNSKYFIALVALTENKVVGGLPHTNFQCIIRIVLRSSFTISQ